MPSIVFRRLSWVIPVLCALLLVLSDSKPAAAQEAQCFQNLRHCYFRAALKESFWEMWAAGLDCELEVVDCVRRKIFGR